MTNQINELMALIDAYSLDFAHYAGALDKKLPAKNIEAHRMNAQKSRMALEAALKPGVEPYAWHTEDHLTDRSATTYSKDMMYRWQCKGWPITPMYRAAPPAQTPDVPQANGVGRGSDAPYPGMIEAFEIYYGQSFTDKDWRKETSVWAAAWRAAVSTAPLAQTGEVVAMRGDFDGYGHQYIDNGSGSDWRTRHPDWESLSVTQTKENHVKQT